VILGPEMKSTGEVMGIDKDFDMAFLKSQLAAGQKINNIKNIFISVKDDDKEAILAIVKELSEYEFNIYTTKGTNLFLKENNINSIVINKVMEGSPHIVEYLGQSKIDLVINTTENKQAIRDSFTIRRTAVDLNVPYYTNLRSAKILCKSIIKLKNTDLEVKPIQKHHIYSNKNSFEF
jgi:carbamoyl-phosphate synthase large subunit